MENSPRSRWNKCFSVNTRGYFPNLHTSRNSSFTTWVPPTRSLRWYSFGVSLSRETSA